MRRINRYKNGDYVYYICSTYNKGKGCTRHGIEEAAIKEIVLDSIRRHIEQIAEMEEIVREVSLMEGKRRDVIAIYSERAAEAEQAADKMKAEMEEVLQKGLLTGEWLKQFMRDRNIGELNRILLLQLVDKIVVHEGRRIEIFFKYEDAYNAAARIVRALPLEAVGGER